jgi:hypothetical protein
MSQYGIGVNEILVFLCLSEGGESLLPRSSEAAHKIPRPTAWPTDLSEPAPIRIGSGSHDLDPPQNNSKGSDDAGSRQGTLQDMDLHCFHPVFVTTPRESYVIPRSGSNPGSGDIHRLVKRAATNRHSDQSRQSVIAATAPSRSSRRHAAAIKTVPSRRGTRSHRAVAATGWSVGSLHAHATARAGRAASADRLTVVVRN